MVYFKGMKNKRVVAIGYDPKNIIPQCKILLYMQITKAQYNDLNKKEFNAPQQRSTNKHKTLAR